MAADSISIFGDYDTFDLTFGAAMASELSHSIPPASPFYAGHWLVYSYFPLLLLAEIHNFSGVSTIQISLAFAWPFFGLLAPLAAAVPPLRRLFFTILLKRF